MGAIYATPLDDISAVESQTTIAQDDLYLINYYDDLIKTVVASCPESDIALGITRADEIQSKLITLHQSYSLGEQLNHTIHLHDSLAALQSQWLQNLSPQRYCALKYIVYSIQSRARDTHLSVMTDTGIIKDFERFAPWWPIHGYDIKEELMLWYIQDRSRYKDLLWVTLEFQKWKQIAGIDYPSIDLMKHSKELMKLTVYKTLYDLRERGLFDDADIQELQDKIRLDMQLSCGTFHGNYSVKENFINWKHESFEVQSIPLNVNVCGNYFLLHQLPHHYLKIVTHELAHHYYYFHDNDHHHTYENICRKDTFAKKGGCTDDDFVTDYAQTQAAEDYAEHFMHWFLGDIPDTNSGIISKKTTYFENKI